MCFSIPAKVLAVKNKTATIEGGEKIRLGNECKAKKGDYIQVSGSIAVLVIPKSQGIAVRKLIKKLNTNYE